MTPHDHLRSLLLTVRRRWRAEAVLRAVGRGSALAAIPVLVGVGGAAWLAPGDGPLTVLALTIRVASLGAVVVPAWRLGRTPGDGQVARFVEERVAQRGDVPPLDDVLVSAVDALAPRDDQPFRGIDAYTVPFTFVDLGADGGGGTADHPNHTM